MYDSIPAAARAYLRIRVSNYPRAMWPYLEGLKGDFISLGAGYALLEAMVALKNPDVRIVASDRNAQRIEIARKALKGIPNLSLEVVDLSRTSRTVRADGFLLLDVLHHLSPPVQEDVLRSAAESLNAGGRIIIKECGTRPAWKKWVNYLNDAIGSPGEKTYPRGEEEWARQLEGFGLQSEYARIDAGAPYAHIVVVARKP